MPDLLIPDLDERIIARLNALAEERELDLGSLLVEMLDYSCVEKEAGLVGEIAAMRSSQPKQAGDAAQDIRRLRDGGDDPREETQAA